MKKVIALILTIVMCLGLAACGNNETPDVPDSSSEQQSSELESLTDADSEDENSHYPVTITNVNYNKEPVEYTYEKAPERVITFWSNSLETMLALGLGDRVICAVGMNEESILPELKPELEKLKEEVKPFAEQEEDVLSFAQFGSVAQKFFERRRNRRFGVDSDGVDFKNKIHSI